MELSELPLQRREAVEMHRKYFGIVYTSLEPGEVTAEWPLREQDINVHGIPFGGVHFTLADSAAGTAIGCMSDSVITISCSGEFISGARDTKKLVCHAKVTRATRTLGFIDSDIYDDRGNLLSKFHFVFGRKQEKPQI